MIGLANVANLLIAYGIIAHISVKGGWIDPETPIDKKSSTSDTDGRAYDLVFSDEFNVDGRNFDDGNDPRWTAINKDDYTNFALQYYNKDLARTSNGFLNITSVIEDVSFAVKPNPLSKVPIKDQITKQTKNYQSAMVQGWNKFCFTGGIVEISARLPGKSHIGGLWPAMWLLGNLARATYVSSSNNVWPWSYNSCSKRMQKQQAFSACNKVNHYDLHPYQGRGAPEIDILEAMPGKEKLEHTTTELPYFSTSFQVAPGHLNSRPDNGLPPPKGTWYEEGVTYGLDTNTTQNIFFYGMKLEGKTKDLSYLADAISANTNLMPTHFEDQHIYRMEWVPGPEGYIHWYLDGNFLYGISALALNKTGAIIPEEPMYLIFNTAISSTWGFPQPCPEGCDCSCFDCRLDECSCGIPNRMCSNFPAEMLIDYVRVYQAVGDDDQIVGCSTPTHPTKRYINGHKDDYKSDGDNEILKSVHVGGGMCKSSTNCGGKDVGNCVEGRCHCEVTTRTGPHCMAHAGFDDIVWDKDADLEVYLFVFPQTFLIWVMMVAIVLVAIVVSKYYNEKHIRSISDFNNAMSGADYGTNSHAYTAIREERNNRADRQYATDNSTYQ